MLTLVLLINWTINASIFHEGNLEAFILESVRKKSYSHFWTGLDSSPTILSIYHSTNIACFFVLFSEGSHRGRNQKEFVKYNIVDKIKGQVNFFQTDSTLPNPSIHNCLQFKLIKVLRSSIAVLYSFTTYICIVRTSKKVEIRNAVHWAPLL